MHLRAYADESGTHRGAAHLTIAGHVSSLKKWQRFDAEWKAVLDKAGIEEVISKDLARGSGVFSKWPKWEFDELGAGMQAASERLGGFGLTTRLDYADYRELYACEPFPKKGRLDSAYGLCFRNWLWTIRDHAADLYANHPSPPKGLYIVLEGGAANAGDAERVFNEMREEKGRKIPLVGFALGSKKMPGIQMAGITAHRTWQRERDKLPKFIKSEGDRVPLAQVRAASREPMIVFRQTIDRDFLREWKAALLEITGTRGKKRQHEKG